MIYDKYDMGLLIQVYEIYYIRIWYCCMVFKIEQFCISFEICSIILNLFLLTHEYIYVTYNRYMPHSSP